MIAQRKVKVLLIDDDPDDYILTRDLLEGDEEYGFDLSWVATYEDAEQAAYKHSPDVILLDFWLGRYTGVDLLKELRSGGCTTPIIMLTGEEAREVDLQAMRAGAAEYLVKRQLSRGLLERAVRYALDQKRTDELLQQALWQQEALLTCIPNDAWLKDADFRYIAVNEAFVQSRGLAREQILGKTDFSLFPPAIAERLRLQDGRVMESGQKIALRESRTAFDGSTQWCETIIAPVRDQTGRVVGTAGISLERQIG